MCSGFKKWEGGAGVTFLQVNGESEVVDAVSAPVAAQLLLVDRRVRRSAFNLCGEWV